MVLPSQGFADQPVCANLDLADFLKDLSRYHGTLLSKNWIAPTGWIRETRMSEAWVVVQAKTANGGLNCLGHRQFIKNLLNDGFAGFVLSLSLEGNGYTVSQHVHPDGFYVLRRYVTTTTQKRVGLCRERERDG